jgi:hypothetical protein
VGRLGGEGPADEIFEILRHRPAQYLTPDTAAFHARVSRKAAKDRASASETGAI